MYYPAAKYCIYNYFIAKKWCITWYHTIENRVIYLQLIPVSLIFCLSESLMYKFIIIILVLLLSGCISSSEYRKRANNNIKASNYYESIGQSIASNEEQKMALSNQKKARSIETFITDLFFLTLFKDN